MNKKIKTCAWLMALLVGVLTMTACNKNNPEPIVLPTTSTVTTIEATTAEPTTENITQESTEPATETTAEAATTEPVTETSPVETSEPVTEATEPVSETTTAATSSDVWITPEIGPSYPAEYPDIKPWDLINNETLNPRKSGNAELDGLLAGFLKKLYNDGIVNDEMTQYQYFRAIYVWYMDHIEYDRTLVDDPGRSATSDPATTPEEILWASGLFNTYKGCCYNYAASFVYLMRYIGYDAYVVSGQCGSYNGGMTPHCWAYIILDGRPYTFDPDVDMNYFWRDKRDGKEELRSDVWFCRRMDDPNVQYFYTIEKEYFN